MNLPLELELKVRQLERRWRSASEEERLEILTSLLNENFTLHTELQERAMGRHPELPPVPPPSQQEVQVTPGLALSLGPLLVLFFWRGWGHG